MIESCLVRLYRLLLYCYPHSFRDEFGDEMMDIFSQAVAETRPAGTFALSRLCLIEIISLPASILTTHIKIHQDGDASSRTRLLTASEQSWKELLLALAVFLLPAVMLLINTTPDPANTTGAFIIDLPGALLFLIVMISAGWMVGIPLRTQPYFGLVFVIGIYLYLFQWVAALVTPSLIANFSIGIWDRSTYLLMQIVSTGMLWMMLFCLTLLVVALLAVFNRFQPFIRRVEHDWSLISFVLYGESGFALLMLLKTYRCEASYAIACLLFLAAGAWFFLRSAIRWQRLLALLSGLTLAMSLAAIEKWLVSPQVGWTDWQALHSFEAGRLFLTWFWIVLALLLPGLLLHRSSQSTPQPPIPPLDSI